jgi:glycosyltransferase involved in cell wall biosynthesis
MENRKIKTTHLPLDHQALKGLSILIPSFNEEKTIIAVLEKVISRNWQRDYEIIVIDDGSTDQSELLIKRFQKENPKINIQYFYKENGGKGSAIRLGIEQAKLDYVIVQDADLEYEPSDYAQLLALMDKGAKVVYGSRNAIKEGREHSTLMFYWGGLLVTYVTNFIYGSKLTDQCTCYKLFDKNIFNSISFLHNDFAWEPELTAKILKQGHTIEEAPISYHPRGIEEGKKITWRDGIKAVWILIKEYFKGQ